MGTRMSLPLRGYQERSLIERSIRKFDFYIVTISKNTFVFRKEGGI